MTCKKRPKAEPCPHCATTVKKGCGGLFRRYLACCHIRGPVRLTKAGAIRAWNKLNRSAMEPPGACRPDEKLTPLCPTCGHREWLSQNQQFEFDGDWTLVFERLMGLTCNLKPCPATAWMAGEVVGCPLHIYIPRVRPSKCPQCDQSLHGKVSNESPGVFWIDHHCPKCGLFYNGSKIVYTTTDSIIPDRSPEKQSGNDLVDEILDVLGIVDPDQTETGAGGSGVRTVHNGAGELVQIDTE